MEGRSSADRRGDRYHVILCVVIGEMTLSTCLLCRLLTQDENQSIQDDVSSSKEEASESEETGSSNGDNSVQDDVSDSKEETNASEEKGSANEDAND